MRRAYLDSGITAAEVELKQLETEAQNRVLILQNKLKYVQVELDRFQDAIKAGTMHAAAAVQMKTQVAEVESQLKLAQAELEIVQRELERRASRH